MSLLGSGADDEDPPAPVVHISSKSTVTSTSATTTSKVKATPAIAADAGGSADEPTTKVPIKDRPTTSSRPLIAAETTSSSAVTTSSTATDAEPTATGAIGSCSGHNKFSTSLDSPCGAYIAKNIGMIVGIVGGVAIIAIIWVLIYRRRLKRKGKITTAPA